MAEQTYRYEVQVAYVYFICYTVDAATDQEAKQKIIDGDGDVKSNFAQQDVRLPPDRWKVNKISENKS